MAENNFQLCTDDMSNEDYEDLLDMAENKGFSVSSVRTSRFNQQWRWLVFEPAINLVGANDEYESYWGESKTIDEIIDYFSGSKKEKKAKKCSCDITVLLRKGCQCDGK